MLIGYECIRRLMDIMEHFWGMGQHKNGVTFDVIFLWKVMVGGSWRDPWPPFFDTRSDRNLVGGPGPPL